MKEYLSEKGVKFAYFDISENFGALKRFLKIRDNNDIYKPVKEAGAIGLPTIIIDDEIILEFEEEKINELLGL